jgi:hypothetical protein
MFHKRPFRCRSCRRRFYGFDDAQPPEELHPQDEEADQQIG